MGLPQWDGHPCATRQQGSETGHKQLVPAVPTGFSRRGRCGSMARQLEHWALSERPRLHQIRVFLSSPGDVAVERKLVREIAEGLSAEPFFRDQAVVAVVGARSGAKPPPAAAAPFAGMLPEGVAEASYTQWEVHLARHHRRRLYF